MVAPNFVGWLADDRRIFEQSIHVWMVLIFWRWSEKFGFVGTISERCGELAYLQTTMCSILIEWSISLTGIHCIDVLISQTPIKAKPNKYGSVCNITGAHKPSQVSSSLCFFIVFRLNDPYVCFFVSFPVCHMDGLDTFQCSNSGCDEFLFLRMSFHGRNPTQYKCFI